MAEPLAKETIIEQQPLAAAPGLAIHRLRSSLPEALRPCLRNARELARELRESGDAGCFPTAVPALDRLLDGGLPRGQLVEREAQLFSPGSNALADLVQCLFHIPSSPELYACWLVHPHPPPGGTRGGGSPRVADNTMPLPIVIGCSGTPSDRAGLSPDPSRGSVGAERP